jgi:hypothetical protein
MRSYVKGWYGQFKEDSDSLGIHLVLRVWRPTEEEFDSTIDDLRADVAAAGGDWTGNLQSKSEFYFDFKHPFIQDFLKVYFHGTSQSSTAIDDTIFAGLTDKSPRGREKRRFKLVPLKK